MCSGFGRCCSGCVGEAGKPGCAGSWGWLFYLAYSSNIIYRWQRSKYKTMNDEMKLLTVHRNNKLQVDILTGAALDIQPIHPSRILTSYLHRIAYANDASYFRLVPQAVVQPNSIDEIQALFKFTQQNKIPMTFRAAGTSFSGQAVTDGILVDISKHWGNYRVEENANLVRFQPGIVGGFINNVLKPFGRRIGPDPASIDACMMGGILANNSSGMCCGVTENSYRTIHSMTFVLPNGFVLNTADPNANEILKNEQTHIANGLLELKQRILNSTALHKGEMLAGRVRRRYQMKNTNGYLLNAFLDFETPLNILTHIMIGSEGTLGFIAEAVLHTLPDTSRRYTGQLYFKNIQDAASAIAPLKDTGARAAEIMDRASLRSVQDHDGVPAILSQLPDGAAAILVEYQAQDVESIGGFKGKRSASSSKSICCMIPNLPMIRSRRLLYGKRAKASSHLLAQCVHRGAFASTKMLPFQFINLPVRSQICNISSQILAIGMAWCSVTQKMATCISLSIRLSTLMQTRITLTVSSARW